MAAVLSYIVLRLYILGLLAVGLPLDQVTWNGSKYLSPASFAPGTIEMYGGEFTINISSHAYGAHWRTTSGRNWFVNDHLDLLYCLAFADLVSQCVPRRCEIHNAENCRAQGWSGFRCERDAGCSWRFHQSMCMVDTEEAGTNP